MAQGISETNSSFRVRWRTARRVNFLFFESFLLALAKLSFWHGDWALFHNFLRS